MKKIYTILLLLFAFTAKGQTYITTNVNGSYANSSGAVTLVSSTAIDSQTLHLSYSDSIRMYISRGNYIAFSYAVDSASLNAGGDSLIVFKAGVRRAYLLPTGGGGSGWELTGNNVADDSTNFIGTTDNQSLPFYTNNTFAMKLTPNKQLALGAINPTTMFHAKSQSLSGSYAGFYTFESHNTNSKLSGWVEPSDSGAVIGLNTYLENSTWRSAQAVGSYIKSNRSGLYFYLASGGTIGGAYSPDNTKGFFIASDGSMNVGTQTNYTYPFTVGFAKNSKDHISSVNTNTGSSAGAGLSMFNGTTFNYVVTPSSGYGTTAFRNTLLLQGEHANGIALNVTNGSAPIIAYQNTTERLRIDANGSLGIGTLASNNASAILQANSTSKGFLMPVMTGAQAEAISSPATGLLVYANNGNGVTITTTGWWGWDGAAWVKLN